MVAKLGIQKTYSPLTRSREYLLKYAPKAGDELPPRSMQDSFTSAILPLSTDYELQDKYVTFLGSCRLGRLMEDMDLFAGKYPLYCVCVCNPLAIDLITVFLLLFVLQTVWVLHQHVKIPNLDPSIPLPYTFVTALVDRISFTDLTPKHDSDIRLSGHVSWVGRTSVEVVVWLEQNLHGKWRKLTRALFLMACRSATNHEAAVVNPLIPGNAEEQKIFDGGETRKRRRKQQQKESLFHQEPNDFEQTLIHNTFMRTIDLKNKTFNARFLPSGSVWMEEAVMSNMIFSHPEDRNAHNAVFGGFLMRHALELSWALAFQFRYAH